MITPENQQVPAVLDQMTTPGLASRVILELIKMLLKRTNTATRHITVSSFSCVSGGALNPSISMLGLFVVTDDGTEKYDLFVDFFKTCIVNNAIGADSPAAISDLYNTLRLYFVLPNRGGKLEAKWGAVTCLKLQEAINRGFTTEVQNG